MDLCSGEPEEENSYTPSTGKYQGWKAAQTASGQALPYKRDLGPSRAHDLLGKLEGCVREQITREAFPGPPQSSRHDKAEKREEIKTSAHDSIQLGNWKAEEDKRSRSVRALPQNAPVALHG